MAFILGIKKEMSQIFQNNRVTGVTIIEAGPCLVVNLKTKKKDGYSAVRLSMGTRKKINKPDQGQSKSLDIKPRWLKEFKIPDHFEGKFKTGDLIKIDNFQAGEKVQVEGLSIGKGFQGVIKRHGFRGKDSTHGTKHDKRRPGSIGATAPQRVFRGKKMPGRTGGQKVTVKNLEIIKIDSQKNLLYLKGAVPGKRGTLLKIESIS